MGKIWRKGETGICLERKDGSKGKKYIQKKEKNKDDKSDNKNKITVWDRLEWVKEKSPVHHNLDGFKQYNFTNRNVMLRK